MTARPVRPVSSTARAVSSQRCASLCQPSTSTGASDASSRAASSRAPPSSSQENLAPQALRAAARFPQPLGPANKHGAAPLQCGGYTLVRKAPGALCRPVVSVHRQHVGPFLKNGRTRACHRRPRAPVPSKTTVAFSGRSRPTYASHESSEAAWRAAMRPKTMFSALPPPEIP